MARASRKQPKVAALVPAKKTLVKFYAVAKGRKVGIFTTWEECNKHVHKFKDCRFKRFDTRREAIFYLRRWSARDDRSVNGVRKTPTNHK